MVQPRRAATRKPSAPARSATGRPTPPPYTHEEVAKRAYQLFIERGGQHGRDYDDWLSAERELSSKGN
jgi:hypothetical protein